MHLEQMQRGQAPSVLALSVHSKELITQLLQEC